MRLYQLNESINDRGIFKAIFLAGIPGAGKTTLLKNISNPAYGVRVVDPDKQVEFLAGKYGLPYDHPAVISQGRPLLVSQLVQFVNGMLPMYVSGTGASSHRILIRDEILESFGYDTAMIWVGTDVETAITSVQMRERKVPLDVIQKNFSSLMEHYKTYEEHFGNQFYLYENVFLTPDENQELQQLLERDRTSMLSAENESRLKVLRIKAQRAVRAKNELGDIQKISDEFFGSPIKNAKGISTVGYLERTGGKYLTDGIVSLAKLKEILTGWHSAA